MFAHLKKCPKIPLQCPDCKGMKFSSLEAMMKHLRHECPNVEIKCSECKEVFMRSKFGAHKCVKETKHLRNLIDDRDARVAGLEAENANLKANVGHLNGQMEVKGKMHGQKATIDKMIMKQKKDRDELYSKLGGTDDQLDRFVYTELVDEICFECCNEGFARDLIRAKKTRGYIYFKGRYMCTPHSRGAPIESFSLRSGTEQVSGLLKGCTKPKVDGYKYPRIAKLEE